MPIFFSPLYCPFGVMRSFMLQRMCEYMGERSSLKSIPSTCVACSASIYFFCVISITQSNAFNDASESNSALPSAF